MISKFHLLSPNDTKMITSNCIAIIIISTLTVLSVGIDGQLIRPREAPYQISLEFKLIPTCAGVIIDAKWILTSAHCVTLRNRSPLPAADLIVRAGSNVLKTGGVAAQVKRIIVHEKYNANFNDLALLELKVPLPVSSPLPNSIKTVEIRKEDIIPNTKVTTYGWASRAPLQAEELKKISSTTISQSDCALQTGLNSDKIACVKRILANNPCAGDSGGGLYIASSGRTQLVGIASTSRSCDSAMPDIYARMSKYTDWINGHKR